MLILPRNSISLFVYETGSFDFRNNNSKHRKGDGSALFRDIPVCEPFQIDTIQQSEAANRRRAATVGHREPRELSIASL